MKILNFLLFFVVGSGFAQANHQELAIILAVPGVEARDLIIYEQDIVAAWRGKKLLEEITPENLDFQVLYSLNLEAAALWQLMAQCYSANIYAAKTIEAVRQAYFSKTIHCGDATTDVLERLKILHLNVKNWAESSEVGRTIPMFKSLVTNLPSLHPLLGQILMELHSYYRVARMPSLKGFELTVRLLDAAGSSCTTFGLWPNAILFLYKGEVFVTEAILTQVLFYNPTNVTFIFRNEQRFQDDEVVALRKPSCWQTTGRVLEHLQASMDFVKLQIQQDEVARVYSGFFQYYSGMKK